MILARSRRRELLKCATVRRYIFPSSLEPFRTLAFTFQQCEQQPDTRTRLPRRDDVHVVVSSLKYIANLQSSIEGEKGKVA